MNSIPIWRSLFNPDFCNRGLIKRAQQVASFAHRGQFRRSGHSYIVHPAEVSEWVVSFGEEVTASAWLHDVIEDTSLTLGILRELNFSGTIVDAVDILTKRPGEDYDQMIRRVHGNKMARIVKIADLISNMADLVQCERLDKYQTALTYLTNGNPRLQYFAQNLRLISANSIAED